MTKQYQYDAFISYRHTPLDMAVATALHKRLEHYKIPKDVQQKTNKKSIKRVFRDRDELPLSANLGDNLIQAIKSSEFLIVICSPESKESLWCRREVQTFLKYHDFNHVLTLLIKGEPDEAFPEELMHVQKRKWNEETEEMEPVLDKDGNPIYFEVEPLAADIRGETEKEVLKKLKDESLRLIAPMLNVSYDALKQRHKAYIRRQKTIIASVVTTLVGAFGIYSSIMSHRVQLQYNQALINQSLYLSNISSEVLKQGDRDTAIKLALAALPSPVNDRPLVEEPIYSLNEAMYSYAFTNRLYLMPHKKIELASSASSNTHALTLNESESHFANIDSVGHAYIGSIDGEVLWEGSNLEYVQVFAHKDNFVFIDKTGISEVDCKGNTVFYKSFPEEDDIIFYMEASVNKDLCALTRDETLYIFDLKKQDFIDEQSLKYCFESNMFSWSPDGKKLCLTVTQGYNHSDVYLYDIKNKSLSLLNPSYFDTASIVCPYFIDDDTLVYMINKERSFSFTIVGGKYFQFGIEAMNLNSQNVVWHFDVQTNYDSQTRRPIIKAIRDKEMFASLGNTFVTFNKETGKIIYISQFEDSISNIDIRNDSVVLITLDNGKIYRQITDEQFNLFDCGSIKQDVENSIWSNKNLTMILSCNSEASLIKMNIAKDENVTVLKENLDSISYGYIHEEDNYYRFCMEENNKNRLRVIIWSTEDTKPILEKTFETKNPYVNKKSLTVEDGEFFLAYEESEDLDCYLTVINLSKDKTIEKRTKISNGALNLISRNMFIEKTYLKDFEIKELKTHASIYKDSGKTSYKDVDYSNSLIQYLVPNNTNQYVFVQADSISKVFDLEKMEWISFEGYGEMLPIHSSYSYKFAKETPQLMVYTQDQQLQIYNLEDGSLQTTIPFISKAYYDFEWFDHDTKAILFNDNKRLQLWDLKKNECICEDQEQVLDLRSISTDQNSEYFAIYTGGISYMSEERVYIYHVDSKGQFHRNTYVQSGLACLDKEEVLIKSTDKKLGYSKFYSLPELIEKAIEEVEDPTLSAEQKKKYFMED